jgi:hypothetical protein
VSALACVASAASLANALPNEIKATYGIFKAGIMVAQDVETFRRDGDTYKIVSETHAEGALKYFFKERITITSEGVVVKEGLRPLAYAYRRADASRSVRARFDWKKSEIFSEHGDTHETFALPAHTQDRLSSMYQFMLNTPTTDLITTWMSTGKKSERYSYLKQGEPKVSTKAGEFATVHYVRDAHAGESRAELWLAKDHFYLPVRVAYTDKNGSFEQVLTSLTTR